MELILAVEYRLRQEVRAAGHDTAGLSFVLLSAAREILPEFPQGFRQRFGALLKQRGIHVMTGAAVTRVEPGRVHINGSTVLPADEVLWMTDARAAAWLPSTGLALDERGFIKTDEMLRAVGHSDIFAAGDAMAFGPRPLPKSGVFSVRSGPVLTENIRRLAAGRPLKAFKPQREAMYLVTAGGKHAIGTRNGLVFGGDWVWRWKDYIDRRFMAAFSDLPQMAADASGDEGADEAMRCGGCGAKVGAGILARALSRIQPVAHPELVAGMDAADDAAIIDTGGDTLTIQTADYFRAMIDDPYMFGKIAANHALGDIYAMGGTPRTALAIATLPHGPSAKVEADLTALLTGANEVLREADCALAGGHTGEGTEMALGFAITGTVPRAGVLRKGGALPGDLLILHQGAGHGHAAGRRYARAGQGALGDGGHRADGAVQPGGGPDFDSPRRAGGNGRHRLRPDRSSGRDAGGGRRGCAARSGPAAGAGRRARDHGGRHSVVALPPERRAAGGHRAGWRLGGASALSAAVRSADGGRFAGGRACRRGRRVSARACQRRLWRGRDHRRSDCAGWRFQCRDARRSAEFAGCDMRIAEYVTKPLASRFVPVIRMSTHTRE